MRRGFFFLCVCVALIEGRKTGERLRMRLRSRLHDRSKHHHLHNSFPMNIILHGKNAPNLNNIPQKGDVVMFFFFFKLSHFRVRANREHFLCCVKSGRFAKSTAA